MKIGYTTQNMDLSPWREGEKPFLVLGILDALLDCSFNYSVHIKKKKNLPEGVVGGGGENQCYNKIEDCSSAWQ